MQLKKDPDQKKEKNQNGHSERVLGAKKDEKDVGNKQKGNMIPVDQ